MKTLAKSKKVLKCKQFWGKTVIETYVVFFHSCRRMKQEPRALETIPEPAEDYIFYPIIASQLNTSKKQRPSIISLKIPGKAGIDGSTEHSLLRRNAGVLFAFFSTLSFSLATLILKIFQQYHQYHPFIVTVWRMQGIHGLWLYLQFDE